MGTSKGPIRGPCRGGGSQRLRCGLGKERWSREATPPPAQTSQRPDGQRGEDRPGCIDEALRPREVCRLMNFVVAHRRHLGRLASRLKSQESTTVGLSSCLLLVIQHHGPLIGIFPASDWAARRLAGRAARRSHWRWALMSRLEVGGGRRVIEGSSLGALATGAVAVLGSKPLQFLGTVASPAPEPCRPHEPKPWQRGRDPLGAFVSANRPSRAASRVGLCPLSTKCWR